MVDYTELSEQYSHLDYFPSMESMNLTNGTHHHYLYVSSYKYTDDFSSVDDLLVFNTYSLSNAEFLQAELTYNYDFSGNGKKGLELKVKFRV